MERNGQIGIPKIQWRKCRFIIEGDYKNEKECQDSGQVGIPSLVD